MKEFFFQSSIVYNTIILVITEKKSHSVSTKATSYLRFGILHIYITHIYKCKCELRNKKHHILSGMKTKDVFSLKYFLCVNKGLLWMDICTYHL